MAFTVPPANSGSTAPGRLRFGRFVIDREKRILLRDGRPVSIQRKPLDVLDYLVEHAPRLVPREELLDRFWSRAVNDEALTRCISTLRKHLDDRRDPPVCIETHRGVGYRFIAPVTSEPGTEVPTRGTGRRLPRPAHRAVASLAGLLLAGLMLSLLVLRPPATRPGDQGFIDRIAVLPVSSTGAVTDWLTRPVTEELRRAVSRIEGVRVIAASRPLPATTPEDALTVGRDLGVDAVLTGRLEPVDGSWRLHADLFATTDGELVWTSSLHPVAPDPVTQEIPQLARAVAARLKPALQLQSPSIAADSGTYRFYLRGQFYLSQRTLPSLRAAIEQFAAAAARDPAYAPALAGAAEAWLLLPLYGAIPPAEALPEAARLADQALQADPEAARSLAVSGIVAMLRDWDWNRAESRLLQATALDPNDPVARQWLGEMRCYQARFAECRRHLAAAHELDPLSPALAMLQGSPDLWAGNYAAAAARYEESARTYPRYALARYSRGLALSAGGLWDEAVAAYRDTLGDLGAAIVGGPLAYALARSGRVEEAGRVLDELRSLAEARYVPPTKLATGYAGLGNRSETLLWLERAVDVRDDRLLYLAVDPHFRDFHDDAGFRSILERIGLTRVLAAPRRSPD